MAQKKIVVVLISIVVIFAGVVLFLNLSKNLNPDHSDSGSNIGVVNDDQALTAPNHTDSISRTIISEEPPTSIFTDAPEANIDHEALESFLTARPIGAYRIVKVDSDALRARIREPVDSSGFEVQLLESAPLRLAAYASEEHSDGWRSGLGTWIGVVEGDETSRASFVVAADGTVNGVVRTLDTGRIKIEPIKGSPYHIVWQWDPNFKRNLD